MSEIVSVEAPANIAFIKYWGARDLERAIPLNPSLSMTLRACATRTSAQVLGRGMGDEMWLVGDGGLQPAGGSFRDRALAHVARLRAWAGRDEGVRIATHNSFPASAGMASSASGFAALTLAVVAAFGRDPEPAELSRLARSSGSGSAARSVLGGYVEWPAEGSGAGAEGAAVQVAPASHWDLRDVIVLVQRRPKGVSSLQGHLRAPTSPHFATRQRLLPERLDRARAAIRERSLAQLGPVLEQEAIELHLIAMSSVPPIFYWAPSTLRVLERVRGLRDDGVPAFATMDAGANVHVICEPGHEPAVIDALGSAPGIDGLMRDRVGEGPRRIHEHLLGAEPGGTGV